MARLGAGTRKRANGTFEKRFTIDGKRYSVYGKTIKELAENEQAKRKEIASYIYMNNQTDIKKTVEYLVMEVNKLRMFVDDMRFDIMDLQRKG